MEAIDKRRAYAAIDAVLPTRTKGYVLQLINWGWSNAQIMRYVGEFFKTNDDKEIFCAAMDYMREQAIATN